MKIIVLIFAIFAICNANFVQESMMTHVNKLSSLKENFENAKEGFESMIQMAKFRHEEIQNLFTQVESDHAKRAPSQECITAYLGFANATNSPTCRDYFLTYIGLTSTLQQRTDAVNGFCGQCPAQFRTAINALIAACPVRSDVPDTIVKLANAVGFYGRFLCAQDSSKKFCAVEIAKINLSTFTDLASVTSDNLRTVCIPCVQISIGVLASGAGFSDSIQTFAKSLYILKAVCVQIQGEFCLPKLKAATDASIQIAQKFQTNATITSNDFVNLLNVICSPCFRLLASRIAFAGASDSLNVLKEFSGLGFLCRKNPQREFCLAKLYDSVKGVILSQGTSNPCASVNLNSTTCPTECSNFVKNLVSKGGCCWGILIDAELGNKNEFRNQLISFMTNCNGGVAPPPPCPSYANATLVIKYTNLLVDFVNNNKDRFLQAVTSDIISHYAVEVLSIKYDVINTRAGQVIQTTAQASTSGTSGGVYNDNNVNCVQTCAVVPPQDPAQDVTVSGSAQNVNIQSGASFITINILFLAFVLLLQLF